MQMSVTKEEKNKRVTGIIFLPTITDKAIKKDKYMLRGIVSFMYFWFVCIGSMLVGAPPSYQFALRSKQFDCIYFFRHDTEKKQTVIDIRFDGKETRFMEKQPKSYDVSGIITESTLIKEGSFESLICKTEQGKLFYVMLKEEPVIQPIVIAPLLEKLIPEIKNVAYTLDILSFTAGDEQVYLALSVQTKELQKPLLFLTAFFLNYNPKTGFLVVPLAIKKILQEHYCINKIQFDYQFKRLFCAGNLGLLCASVQSGTVEINHQQKTIYDIVIAPESYCNDIKQPNDITDLAFMTTSTALSYIILRDAPSCDGPGNRVRAFPLSADHMLAAKDAIIDDIFYLDGIKHFLYRRLLGSEKTTAKLSGADNPACLVGFGTEIGMIQKMRICGDSIVVLAKQGNEQEKELYCLYKSTALFFANGLIKDWTNWQLIHKSEAPIVDFEFDRISGEFVILRPDSISFSGWTPRNWKSRKEEPKKQNKPNTRFHDACIASVFYAGQEIDFFAAISGNTLFYGPLEIAGGDSEALQRKEFPGTVLQSVHLCADSLTQKTYCFLSTQEGIVSVDIDQDTGMITTIEKPVSSIKNIKKIVIDQDYLFALSDKELYRVKKDDAGIVAIDKAENILDPLLQHQCGTLLDMIVSDSFVLLASTRGLWSIKFGCSATKDATIFCEKINLPYHVGFPAKLYAFSKDGIASNVARYQVGNIHVLCIDYSLGRSQLYRFSLTLTEKENTKGYTLQLFDDIILHKTNAPFINFGSLQQDCFFDGIRYLLPSCKQQVSLSVFPRLGKIMSGNNLVPIARTDFQNERILYTGINTDKELVIVSEHGIYCYE
jgi:hypothetical protein